MHTGGALGLRTPWVLLRDGFPVIMVPGGSGSIGSRLSPWYSCPLPVSNRGLPCNPESSIFAEATTPVIPLYPDTVDSHSSTQDPPLIPFSPLPTPPTMGLEHKSSLPAELGG